MNRLVSESSPYLRQHADNPVDWYAWGDEAFAVAKAENKPVLLSVGYAACHWCHVMAHESFEDQATAKLMNEWFVNIKVDREERPDVDAVYMDAVQALTGQGGWPMTVFLTPDAKPFFAGTYFPKESFGGHRSFTDVITAVADVWHTRTDDIITQAQELTDAISQRTIASSSADDIYANAEWWNDSFRRQLHASHDAEWGGFGGAPKFPPSMAIDSLLRSNDELDLQVAITTLDAMAAGGIYDQLGGGFHRYSVDAFWMVPHFEKMLYDQALISVSYLNAYLRTDFERFRQIAQETIEFVLRDMSDESGAFYSAIDADSEGEEGLFYIWRATQIAEVLQDDQLVKKVQSWYGCTNGGNFEGANILHRPDRSIVERPAEIEAARVKLLNARAKRIAPLTDDKVLTEWNAMFISALTQCASVLSHTEWLTRAESAAEFLFSNLLVDGRWMRTWHKSTGARIPAFAADYAWLIDMCTRLGEATGKAIWRERATQTADQLLDLFWDSDNLFTSGKDTEALIVKQKDLFDGAIPSANSVAATALARLGLLTANKTFTDRAESIIKAIAEPLVGHPTAFPYYFTALDCLANNPTTTVVAGDHPELVTALQTSYAPRNVVLWGETDDNELWTGKTDGAYVCRNQTCDAPTTDPDNLIKELE